MGSKITFLDRAIAVVSPETAVRRAVARYHLNEFASGEWDNRQRGSSGGRSQNASSESPRRRRKRINEIWESRDMEERNCLVRGILDRYEQYVCGQITYQSRTGDTDVDKLYQDYFHDWCSRADITGRFRLQEMAALGFRGTVREGEYGWITVPHGDEWRLQAVEADRIGSPDNVQFSETNINGININAKGQVTKYEIYRRSVNQGQYVKDVDVPAENFIHLFRPLRPDQYHGDSWLAPALPHVRDIHELFGFEKQAMKFASAFAGFIRRKDPFSNTGGVAWGDDKKYGPGSNSFSVQAGMIRVLAEGEDIQFPTSTGRPSGNLIQFVEILIREIALALDLPYGFVYSMAALGGVTARIEVQQAMRTIRRSQKMLEDRMLNRVRDLVLERAIAFGKLPPHPNWRQGKWSFGGTLSGDSGADIQTKLLLMQNGLIPAGNIIEELDGSSNQETLATIAREIKEAQELGADPDMLIPMELLAPGRFANATSLLAAINTPPEAPPPQPRGLIAKQGDKAAGPLLELLDKYANGLIERESAIETLVHLYGVTRDKAEKIISE